LPSWSRAPVFRSLRIEELAMTRVCRWWRHRGKGTLPRARVSGLWGRHRA
jgi:hypothetical protein